jgi:hypothetical protein
MAEQFRTAHDTMGEMQIPIDALWGASTQRAVENFPISGQPVPAEVVHAHAMLKWAAATANEETGVVEAEVADAIRRAADEVIAGELDEHFPVDVFQTGSGTSTNMNVNEVVANRAKQLLGEDLTSSAGPPQRPRQRLPVVERHVPDLRARRGRPGRRRTSCCRRSATWRRGCAPRPTSGRTWSSRAAPT